MNTEPEELYLELLKRTVSFALWPEPPLPVETFNYQRSLAKRSVLSAISTLLKYLSQELQLVQRRRFTTEERLEGRIWPGYAETMIGLKRLDNLHECIVKVLKEAIPGDLIETGVWRGGACIFMRGVLAAYKVNDRRVFVADSFEGLPKPDAELYPADSGDKHHVHGFLAVAQQDVEQNFRKYGLLDDRVVFLKGWFKDTLPHAPIEKLSILRLDGDMYGSTMDALDSLYPKLQRGGFCIIDDYFLPGCRQAVDDYRTKFGIHDEPKTIDRNSCFWRKD
jgi:hypothetical protein